MAGSSGEKYLDFYVYNSGSIILDNIYYKEGSFEDVLQANYESMMGEYLSSARYSSEHPSFTLTPDFKYVADGQSYDLAYSLNNYSENQNGTKITYYVKDYMEKDYYELTYYDCNGLPSFMLIVRNC